ncbi:MAG: cell division protein ZapA [Treponema sp.]|nr:cell division protein ZapA [Treponema sp.]
MNGSMPETKNAVALHDLLIDALGTKFSITTNEAPEFLDKVLAQYQAAIENTRNISGMKDPLKISILTGFLLCAEINKLKIQIEKEQTDIEQEISRITRDLIASIDHVMEEFNPINE